MKTKRIKGRCEACALLAESTPLAVRLRRLSERAEAHADALDATVGTLADRFRARRYASIRRWRGIAAALRRKAQDARSTVEYQCAGCAARAAVGAAGMRAWWEAGETGVLTVPERDDDGAPTGYGIGYGWPDMTLRPERRGKANPADLLDKYLHPANAIEVRADWTHDKPRTGVRGGMVVVRCACGDRYKAGLAHRCADGRITRAGNRKPETGAHATPSQRGQARAVKASARAVAGVALNVADVMARARASAVIAGTEAGRE